MPEYKAIGWVVEVRFPKTNGWITLHYSTAPSRKKAIAKTPNPGSWKKMQRKGLWRTTQIYRRTDD